MMDERSAKKDRYYTTDHEWIDFQGSVAYIGVCTFKLSGFKAIDHVKFKEASGFKKQGEPIAIITHDDYHVEVQMPVDGKLIQFNDLLITGDPGILLQQAEDNAWVALIVPSQPYERKNLLLPKQYRLNGKDKYAK